MSCKPVVDGPKATEVRLEMVSFTVQRFLIKTLVLLRQLTARSDVLLFNAVGMSVLTSGFGSGFALSFKSSTFKRCAIGSGADSITCQKFRAFEKLRRTFEKTNSAFGITFGTSFTKVDLSETP